MSTWYCHQCKRSMEHMGVPNHRAMHRRRKDGPFKMSSETHIYQYDYRDTE